MALKYTLVLSTALFFVGCGGGSTDSETSNTANTTITLPSSYSANNGRLLTSVGCYQCHGTNGNSVTSWDSIAGEGEFASENFSNHPIMQAIADGYELTEKNIIDSWLNSQPKNDNNDNDDNDNDDNDD